LHIAELSGKSNRQLGKYLACSAARRTARPCVHVRAPFAAHAGGFLIYPAIVLGLAIPALIYALTKVAATLWI
jgi:hypothetical protein